MSTPVRRASHTTPIRRASHTIYSRPEIDTGNMTPRRSARLATRTHVSLENGRGFSLVEKTVVEHGPYFKAYVYVLESFIPLLSWVLSFILTLAYFLKKYGKTLAFIGLLSFTFMLARTWFNSSNSSKIVHVAETLKYPELTVPSLEETVAKSSELPISSLEETVANVEGIELEQVKEKVVALEKVVREMEKKDTRKEINEQVKMEVGKLKILDKNDVKEIIQQVVKTDSRVNYALKSRGARVIEASRDFKSGFRSFWLKLLFPNIKKESRNKVEEVLESSKRPGECWAMDGDKGFVDIVMSQNIIPESVVIHHASLQEITNFASAPKWIQVFSRNTLIGNGTFDPRVEALNVFNLKKVSRPIDSLRVNVLSNWGHQDYTCIYQIQVFS